MGLPSREVISSPLLLEWFCPCIMTIMNNLTYYLKITRIFRAQFILVTSLVGAIPTLTRVLVLMASLTYMSLTHMPLMMAFSFTKIGLERLGNLERYNLNLIFFQLGNLRRSFPKERLPSRECGFHH